MAHEAVAEFKQVNRKTWASGDWDEVSKLIAPVGPALLDRIGIEPEMGVLDVGTGSGGTVAIPAAQRGARVVGSDLTPELFEAARRRAAEAGVEVEWVEGDAEQLPFADDTFDRVLSTFGHMFAPRHALAGAELARVLKPGGVLATATWTPSGVSGAMIKTVGSHLPAPPDFAESPLLWGTEDHTREMLEPHGLELEFERESVRVERESAEDYTRLFENSFGPIVMAKTRLGDRWPQVRGEILALFESSNVSDDGSFALEPEYLVTVGRKSDRAR